MMNSNNNKNKGLEVPGGEENRKRKIYTAKLKFRSAAKSS
jgi:hypothetical protein